VSIPLVPASLSRPVDVPDEDVRTVVELASLAPSVHNSQPWRFVWDTAAGALEVREDATRALPVLDAGGRERVLSCGAAVLHARLALASLSWDVRADLLPEEADPTLLARLVVVGRTRPSAADADLATAIPRRSTDRERYDERPLPTEVVSALHAAVDAEGAWARVVGQEGSDEPVELQLLLGHADELLRADPAYRAELAAWRRDDAVDGVPSSAVPAEPVARRGSSWALRDFDPAEHEVTALVDDDPEPPVAEHPTVLVLGTEGDDRAAWLTAGQALARLLLTATVHGLSAQPLTQLMEVPVLRERARHALGLVGSPQVLLRLGYPASSRPGALSTSRRPVEQTLTVQR
jgi:nitroreductase